VSERQLLWQVKLLFDENLSPRLSERVASLFGGSKHVHECDLGASDDGVIWQFALDHRFVLVSKDLDFYERTLVYGHPPN
jgi:predicted nuclease of predicted toxin-antitoxin system